MCVRDAGLQGDRHYLHVWDSFSEFNLWCLYVYDCGVTFMLIHAHIAKNVWCWCSDIHLPALDGLLNKYQLCPPSLIQHQFLLDTVSLFIRLQLRMISTMNWLIVCCKKCQKIVKNSLQIPSEPSATSLNCFFYPTGSPKPTKSSIASKKWLRWFIDDRNSCQLMIFWLTCTSKYSCITHN